MKKEDRIRLEAASLLLDRGMRFKITDAPFYLKLVRLDRLRIRPLKAGTIAEITRITIENGLLDVKTGQEANGKIEPITEVVAVSILNGWLKIRWFTGWMKRFLAWNIPEATLYKIYFMISQINKVSDFMIITRYFGIQVEMMMNPKIEGQTKTGS